MGLSTQIIAAVNGMAQLAIKSNKIFNKAMTEINKPSPTYTADDLTRDVTQLGLQTLLLWLKFWMPLGDPVLPTAVISAKHDQIVGQNPKGHVSVADPIPVTNPATPITVTPLVFVGWSQVPAPTDASQVQPLSATVNATDPLQQDLTVTLTVPNTAPVPEQGFYQGLVLVADRPVAVVVVQST